MNKQIRGKGIPNVRRYSCIWVFYFWLCQVFCSGRSWVALSGASYSSDLRASNLEKQALKGSVVVAQRLSFSGMWDLNQGSNLYVPPPPIARQILNHWTAREAKSTWFLNFKKGNWAFFSLKGWEKITL